MNELEFINAQTEAFTSAVKRMVQHALIDEIEDAFLWNSYAVQAWKLLLHNALKEDYDKVAFSLHKLAAGIIEHEAALITQDSVKDRDLLMHALRSMF